MQRPSWSFVPRHRVAGNTSRGTVVPAAQARASACAEVGKAIRLRRARRRLGVRAREVRARIAHRALGGPRPVRRREFAHALASARRREGFHHARPAVSRRLPARHESLDGVRAFGGHCHSGASCQRLLLGIEGSASRLAYALRHRARTVARRLARFREVGASRCGRGALFGLRRSRRHFAASRSMRRALLVPSATRRPRAQPGRTSPYSEPPGQLAHPAGHGGRSPCWK